MKSKTIKVRKNSKKIPKENIDDNGALRIDQLSLMTMLRLEAELRASRSELQNNHYAYVELCKKIDPQGILAAKRQEIQAKENRLKEFQEQYEACKKGIEERLNIDLSKVSYDDVTGVIFEDPDPAKDAQALKG